MLIFESSGVDAVEDGVERARRIIDETLDAEDAIPVEVDVDAVSIESVTLEVVDV